MSQRNDILGTKVAVLGGAGGIGQSFCLLLKQSPLISHLAIYDIAGSLGVAADLSHINTKCAVQGFTPENDGLAKALYGSDTVVITAGKAQRPGVNMDDLFKVNAGIIAELISAIAKYRPKAIICIITNPINSLVPLAARIMENNNVLDTRRIFGVLSLNVMRASLFAAKMKHIELGHAFVPVIGGHSEKTIVPVFSQIRPAVLFTAEEQAELTQRVKTAIFEVIKAKSGTSSATLSMAHSAYSFVQCLLEAMHGVPGVVECAYVRSDITEAKYMCSPLLLGPCGVEVNLGLGPLHSIEQDLLKQAVEQIKKDINMGEEWLTANQ